MEQNKKSRALLAAAVVGVVYWIALIIALVYFTRKETLFVGTAVDLTFAQIIRGIVEGIKSGDEFIKILGLLILWVLAFLAAPVLSLIAWLKNSKIPAYIAAVLFLTSFNLISVILCVTGTRPRFLQGKKTMLFIAAYIGIVLALLSGALPFLAKDGGGNFAIGLFYFPISLLIAVAVNFLGWRKNNAVLTLIASIVYILSVLGIPSAVLCFIGRVQLKKQDAVKKE